MSMIIIILFLGLSTVATQCACSPRAERFWPLNNDTHAVNLGQSSPFGPRSKISENSRYDFHRGVDIPTPLRSEVYAIDDGTIRIPGLFHSGFSDGVIQLRHVGWDDDGDTSMEYFSTYIHLNESFLQGMEVNTFVPKGTLIGLTGETNDFPHLHFEIRAGTLFSGHACNPWKYLPCDHCSPFRANTTVAFEQSGEICSATVQVSVPPDQLTFQAVQLEITGGESEYNRTVDLCEINIFHTNYPTYNTTRLDDNTIVPNLTIIPHFFNSASYGKNEWSSVDYTFLELPTVEDGGTGRAAVTVYDVYGERVTFEPVFYSSTCSEVAPPSDPTTLTPTTTTAGESTEGTVSGGDDLTEATTTGAIPGSNGSVSAVMSPGFSGTVLVLMLAVLAFSLL